jgi:ATP-binding cassette subfamily B protein
LPQPFFDSSRTGDFVARLNDTARIQRVISHLVSATLIDSLVVIVSLVVLFGYSVSVALVCVSALPVFFLLVSLFNRPVMRQQKAVMGHYAGTEANFISTLQGVDTIKGFNLQTEFVRKNESMYGAYQYSMLNLGSVQARLGFWANTFSVCFMTGVLLYGSFEVAAGRMQVGALVAVLTLCGTLLPAIASLALVSIQVSEAKVAFNRMFEFAGLDTEPVDEPVQGTPSIHAISIRDLSFQYPGRLPLLRELNIEFIKGMMVAVMGENGSGKSTFARVLHRQYALSGGEMLINHASPVSSISLDTWRKACMLVPQHLHIFNGSVLENIGFSDAVNKPEQVIRFLMENGFAPFLDQLPQSVFTLVGEEGLNLSGGQRQLIGIARALYARPDVLILDESTAAMDRDSERFVLKLLSRLKKDMIIILITHRLHVLRQFCDRIYILDKGKVSSAGDHAALLQSHNLYSDYWKDLVEPGVMK